MNTVSSNRRAPAEEAGHDCAGVPSWLRQCGFPHLPTHPLEVTIQTVTPDRRMEARFSQLLATAEDDVTTYAWTAAPAAPAMGTLSNVGTFNNGGCRRPDLDSAGYNGGKPDDHPHLDCDRQRASGTHPTPRLWSRSRSVVPTRRSASRQRDQTVLEARFLQLQATSADKNTRDDITYEWTAAAGLSVTRRQKTRRQKTRR